MKVLLTATSLLPAYGGPAFSVSRLAAALAEAGVEVGLWAADGSAPATPLLPADAEVRRLQGPVRDAARAFQPHVVHDNGLWLAHNHRIAGLASASGWPRIVSVRGMLEPWAVRHKRWKKAAAWRVYQRRDLEKASALHATAPPEAENLRPFRLSPPIRTIPNGMDLPILPGGGKIAESGLKTALFIGRIYPVKGLPMLVEAWRRVRPSGWRLIIAGPDEAGHRREVERAVETAGLAGAVTFAGPVLDEAKTRLLADADLFVLPSHSESFGMAVAEALAHALPVLTTTAVPWPALEARQCGWRAAPTPDALAEALRAALSHETSTLEAMGRAGRELIEAEFGWDRVAAQFVSLYEKLARRAEPSDWVDDVAA